MSTSEIDNLIAVLGGVLDQGTPSDLVDWVKRYAMEGEDCNYGTNIQVRNVERLMGEYGISKGQHEDIQKVNCLKGESAQIVAEFIAGQLLKFSIHPRYFLSVSETFKKMHPSTLQDA